MAYDEVFDLGPVPTRIDITADTVRRLIDAQFPQWAELPIRQVANEGWDNRTFLLGSELSVRLPSAESYALAVEKEHRWLPVLAPRLPLQIPVPVGMGAPGEGYPHPWSVYRWLDGTPAELGNIADLTAFASELAEFLLALREVPADGGPEPGLHNWYRGGLVETYGGLAQNAMEALDGRIRTDVAREIWRRALLPTWDRRPVWFHGDVAQGNLLVRDGRLAAVIDFGTCGIGDPACDLAITWTLLRGESRKAFRDKLALDPDTWARGRGWALWKTLGWCAGSLDSGGEDLAAAMYVLDQIFEDFEASE